MNVVYGGAFNPPTKAHVEVYRFLMEKLPIARFIFLPVSSVYGKDVEADRHRYAMLERLTETLPGAEVSALEMEDETYRGTYHSLTRLSDETETAFVIGADHLKTLPRWKNAEKLLSEFRIIVLNRGGEDLRGIIEGDGMLSRYAETFILFPEFHLDISASTYRTSKDPGLLPDPVRAYIERYGLYEE